MGGIVVEAQKCAIPGGYIPDNFHHIRYNLERVNKIPEKDVALVNLYQSKVFDRVDH